MLKRHSKVIPSNTYTTLNKTLPKRSFKPSLFYSRLEKRAKIEELLKDSKDINATCDGCQFCTTNCHYLIFGEYYFFKVQQYYDKFPIMATPQGVTTVYKMAYSNMLDYHTFMNREEGKYVITMVPSLCKQFQGLSNTIN